MDFCLGWNKIGLNNVELSNMCENSWYVLYVYDKDSLVGTGRIISDGVITGVICGVGVLPNFQSKGIGQMIVSKLVEQCEKYKIFPQLFCEEKLVGYYENTGFEKFSSGMIYRIER